MTPDKPTEGLQSIAKLPPIERLLVIATVLERHGLHEAGDGDTTDEQIVDMLIKTAGIQDVAYRLVVLKTLAALTEDERFDMAIWWEK